LKIEGGKKVVFLFIGDKYFLEYQVSSPPSHVEAADDVRRRRIILFFSVKMLSFERFGLSRGKLSI
jgi:hypothetical protein